MAEEVIVTMKLLGLISIVSMMFLSTTAFAAKPKKATGVKCDSHNAGVCATWQDAQCEYVLHNGDDTGKVLHVTDGPDFSFLVETKGGTCRNVWVSDECRIVSSRCNEEERSQLKARK